MLTPKPVVFPPFRLDLESEQLWRGSDKIPLRPKAFAVLWYLVEHPGRLVSRDDLVQAVWGETKVSEGVLRGCLREIRQALGDAVDSPQFIETVPRRGWRFIGTVSSQHSVASSQRSAPALSPQYFMPENAHQETASTNLDQSVETASSPAAVNGLQQTDSDIDHVPVGIQPHGEALNDVTQAKHDPAPLTTDVQPLEIPSPFQPVNKNRRWTTTFVIMGLLLMGGVIVTLRLFPLTGVREEPTLPFPDKPSLVVLPFVNLSGDPEQDYFSDGLTADLTGDLSQIPDLFVIARHSAFTYKGKAVTVQQVGQELEVEYVVEGSVSKSEDQVRIRVELIEATTGFQLWAERYDGELKELFDVQDTVVRQIVTTLRLQIPLWEKGWAVRKRTERMEAYDVLLQGMHYALLQTPEANTQARHLFEQAIALDPQYAWAYVSVANTYFTEYLWGWDRNPQAIERAFALAQQALTLDATLPTAHSLLSWISLWKKQPQQALTAIAQALALDSNHADSYARQAEVLNTLGRAEEALQSITQAMRLNPRHPSWYLVEAGWAYRLLWRHEEAIHAFTTLLGREPHFLTAYMHLAICYLQQYGYQLNQDSGTLQQALEVAQRMVSLSGVSPWSHRVLGGCICGKNSMSRPSAKSNRPLPLIPFMRRVMPIWPKPSSERGGMRRQQRR
jgi:TolB-like protein/DNA-binding winged helix-turn-helix (wHTH) protein/Tfp pilus assembly protein PilF